MFSWNIATQNTKGPGWYTTAGVFSLAFIIWGIFVGLYALSIVVFIFVGVYLMMENNAPEVTQIAIDENGININGGFYDYPSIEDFSIVYDNKKPIFLRLRLKKRGLNSIDIDLTQDVNSYELRNFLLQYIPESEKGGELTSNERLMRYLKI
ncbi:hypothetical protein COW06_01345 [Candidatus Gracilibacteria bacterium CG12_big_fil_rev_8_21_14_0_65_38_15]|nr:MAG: hypothetical protein COW68_02920 [Candidatus Gracilibacteria bacterium CG18_big_fil_WC_8_21_14_2_50_38_16]PIQ41962.1 MAG: hypothetical protein COW06_01345 [Candidatus Gracilibacteria bacterium CG12_big_fil_rev_8_21_14_0_65_38_15]